MTDIHDGHLDRIRTLQQAYSALQKDLPLLEERIHLLRAVIDAKPAPCPDDASSLNTALAHHHYDLGFALYEHFMHVKEANDLVEADIHLRLALAHFPLGASSLGPSLTLGSVLRERAEDKCSRAFAEEALSWHNQPFLAKVDLSDLERARCCRELGLTLHVHYLTNVDEESHLVKSVQQLKEAQALFVKIGVVDHACSAGLVRALLKLHSIQPNSAYLTEACSLSTRALMQCAPDHRDFYGVLSCVSHMHRVLPWYCHDTAADFEYLDLLHTALLSAPPGWATILTIDVVHTLRLRFMMQGNEGDLFEAITQVTSLLNNLIPEASQWDQLQESLADVLWFRFSMTGAAEDIENAAHAAELALSKTSAGASVYLRRLGQLSLCRGAQYRAFGDIAHLNDCIALNERIVHLAPSQSTYQLLAKQNLLDTLRVRTEATGDLFDLNYAISLAPDSPKSQTFNHPNAVTMLHEVGRAFLLRFEMTGSLDDLELATTWHQHALQTWKSTVSSPGYEYHNILNANAKVLRARYEVYHDKASIVEALAQQKQLLAAIPAAHADRPDVLCNLAQTLMSANPEQQDIEAAIGYLIDALSNSFCPAYIRLKAVVHSLAYLVKRLPRLDHENSLRLSVLYSTAISLLPQLASFGLDPRTRLAVISVSGQLTAQGASHAMSIGQYELALEMLEAGRSVVWTQGLRLRTPFTDLPPELSHKLTKITSALGQPMSEFEDSSAKERELARRRRLGDEFEAALAEARQLPGFQHLLDNASFATLAQAAQKHPIVVLVAGEASGHAIIILENAQCIPVALEKAIDKTLQALSQRIVTYSQGARSSRGMRKVQPVEPHPAEVYRELWTLVMSPIIGALGWPKAEGRSRRRLILCPTGVFMQLPLHAAGIYTGDNQVCCSDFLVSTYVPSMGALLHAQRTCKPVRRCDASTLVVAVEHSFEGSALPLTSIEAMTIRSHVSSTAKVVQVSQSKEVFEHIQSASIVHMACHGTQNLANALQSGFFLEDELLPVSKLMQLELPRAFLAVLSACETAKGDAAQPDQAIHLAAAMLFAGFKSVVATMWFMRDLEGPQVAESIYSALFNDGSDSDFLDPEDVPYALDDAVGKMRTSGVDPSFWATYVHIGI